MISLGSGSHQPEMSSKQGLRTYLNKVKTKGIPIAGKFLDWDGSPGFVLLCGTRVVYSTDGNLLRGYFPDRSYFINDNNIQEYFDASTDRLVTVKSVQSFNNDFIEFPHERTSIFIGQTKEFYYSGWLWYENDGRLIDLIKIPLLEECDEYLPGRFIYF